MVGQKIGEELLLSLPQGAAATTVAD
jgi:hypothetical protein